MLTRNLIAIMMVFSETLRQPLGHMDSNYEYSG